MHPRNATQTTHTHVRGAQKHRRSENSMNPARAGFEELACDARNADTCDVLTLCEIWRALDFPDPDERLKSSYGRSASGRSVKPCQKGLRDDRTETVTRASRNGTDGDGNA